MKVHHIFLTLLAAGLLAAAPRAQAQVVISVGNGQAHQCFIFAKSGTNLLQGALTCTGALEHDILSKKDRAGTYDNRGVINDLLGRTQKAADDFNMAIELDPTLGDPYVNLGAMMIKKGQYEESLVQINKGLDLGMAFPHIGYY